MSLTLTLNENGAYQLPNVEKIQGIFLTPHHDAERAQVSIQYTTHTDKWCELKMGLLDALYLLNLLEAMSTENKLHPLRRPPESQERH